MSSVRVTKLHCSGHSTLLTAPSHQFPTGARIQVKGISGLEETEILFADHCSGHTFNLCRDVCVEVACIDTEKSIIQTKRPHQISDTHAGIELRGMDPKMNHVKLNYWVASIVDPYSLSLESWCKQKRGMVPAELSELLEATVHRKRCSVVLGEGKTVGNMIVTATASLVPHLSDPSAQKSRIRRWQNDLRAARAAGKLPEAPSDGRGEPEINFSSLHVGQCGWSDCQGIFQRSGPLQFNLGPGLVSIVYVDELKAWCLLAEVASLYPLFEQRLLLGLEEDEGVQLLYIRPGNSVLGQWEPVIGPAPGPEITIYKEVAVRQVAANQQSILLNPGVGSVILDLLFNYTHADWRGGVRHGNVWGLSAVEAMVAAVRLWRSMQDCSAVCQAWQQALLPFNNLRHMCYHALQIKSPELVQQHLELPSVTDAAVAIIFAASSWRDGLKITNAPCFHGKAWPAHVSEVRLLSELGDDEDHHLNGPTPAVLNRLSATFLQVMRRMLHGIPLAWKTRPSAMGLITMSDGRRYASCDLLDFVRCEKSCHAFMESDADGRMKLLSPLGVELLPHDWSIMDPLTAKGLRLDAAIRRWTSSRLKPRAPGEPCGFPFCQKLDTPCHICAKDVQGRTRLGASQLSGGYTMSFIEDTRKIILEIDVKLIPFFATCQDFSLAQQLGDLLPWEASDSEGRRSEGSDGDEEQDSARSTRSTEDLEEDQDSESPDSPPRRRLRGKQPPPPEWQNS